MTYATKHNGGVTNINPNFIGDNVVWSNATLNCMKSCQTWTYGGNAWPNPRFFDTNYYPLAACIAVASLYTVNFFPSQAKRPGNYIVLWDGKAKISASVGSNGTATTLDTTSTGGINNRMVMVPGTSPDDGLFQINIIAVGPDVSGMSALSNLRVCHALDETALATGQIWSPIWLNLMKQLNPGSIRMMNWQYTNTPNHSQFATRKPLLASVWAGPTVYPPMDFGSTANSGADYSITTSRGALTHGETMHCQFNAPNPTAAQSCSISATNPAVVTATAHGRSIGDPIGFGITNIASAGNNGSGKVRLTLAAGSNANDSIAGKSSITVSGFGNGQTTEANGTWTSGQFTVVDATHVDLTAATFVTASTGAGQIGTFSPNTNSSQPYYIISAGFGPNIFQVSLTKGGPAWSNTGDSISEGLTFTRCITLNRDGKGAIPMLDDYGNVCAATVGGLWNTSGRVYQSTLVYDAFCNVWFMSGNSRYDEGYNGDDYINDCTVPLEAQLDLCAQVGAHPMFSAWVDGMYNSTGLHRDHATFCKNWIATNGVSWMKYRMEGPNEFWNYPKFGVYDTSRAIARNMIRQQINTIDLANPYGWGMTEIGQEISGVFGGDATKYDVIVSVNVNQPTSENAPRLNSDEWMAQGSAPSGYVLQPAKNYATSICCQQYITSPLAGNSTEVAMQDAYTGGDSTQLGLYLDSYGGTVDANYNITHIKNVHTTFATWALGLGVTKFTGYEGGYSPDYKTADPTYTLRRDAKQYTAPSAVYSGGIYHVIQNLVDTFLGVSSTGMTMEFPAVFQFEGANPSNNVWSIQEDIFQPASEQLKAYGLINTGKRRYIAKQS